MDDTPKRITYLLTKMQGKKQILSVCPSCKSVKVQVVLIPSLTMLAVCDNCGWEEEHHD